MRSCSSALLGALAAWALGCTPPQSCLSQLESLSREFGDATRTLDRTCVTDDDCELVVADLGCLEVCGGTAINEAGSAEFARIRDSISAKCDGTCAGSFDCLNAPRVARCRGGLCRGEP